jgi:hypothetical protein
MKKILYAFVALMVIAMASCNGNGTKRAVLSAAGDSTNVVEVDENDSTVYGVAGDGSAMHSLELITDDGDTIIYLMNLDSDTDPVVGGIMTGDRMAVIGYKDGDGEMIANKVINITTLLGKWTSIDKNFQIEEGGKIESYVKAEQNPWTSWRISNGRLVINRDTFDINNLSADSLSLENKNGIFGYKRQK